MRGESFTAVQLSIFSCVETRKPPGAMRFGGFLRSGAENFERSPRPANNVSGIENSLQIFVRVCVSLQAEIELDPARFEHVHRLICADREPELRDLSPTDPHLLAPSHAAFGHGCAPCRVFDDDC